MSAMLEVHKLTAGYRRPVIRDISFTSGRVRSPPCWA